MIKIRKTKTNEWKNIKDKVNEIEKNTFEKELQYEDIDFETFKNKKAINLLLFNDDRVVGYLMSSRLEDDIRCNKDVHYGKFDTYYLESIAIIPKYQGKGLGKKLFSKFLGLVKQKGCRRVLLDAASDSMEKLALFYSFKKIRHHKNWEGSRSAWFMERIL